MSSALGKFVALHPLFSIKTSDDSTCKSSFYKFRFVSKTYQTSSCWLTTTNCFSTWELMDPRIRKLLKTAIHHWLTCYNLKEQTIQQLMGWLPSSRIQPSRPFINTEVDFAVPNFLRDGTHLSKTIVKGYVAIFVWFATKEIHIEVVTSLTT